MTLRVGFLTSCVALSILCMNAEGMGPKGVPTPLLVADRQKAATEREASGRLTNYLQLVNIRATTGIQFDHLSSHEAKFTAGSKSRGTALINYDCDGWPDIHFTNAQDVEMDLQGAKARSVLFHNNHNGTFTDVTDKTGMGYRCRGTRATVAITRNDGGPDGEVETLVNLPSGRFYSVRREGLGFVFETSPQVTKRS